MQTYEFKHNRPRLLIIGYGDIGKRILEQKLTYPNSTKNRDNFFEHFKTIIVSRHGFGDLTDKKARILKNKKIIELKLDLDTKKNVRKIAQLPTHIIILIPPKRSNLENSDYRMKNFCSYLKANKQSKNFRGVYISTTGVYGNTDGDIVDETFRCKPKQPRAKRRYLTEQIFKGKPKFHILRVPGIYAKDRLPIERLKKRLPALISSQDVYTNHIHAEDLAKISFISLFRGKPCRTTNTVDNCKIKMGDYFDEVANAFKLKKPRRVSKSQMKILEMEKKISPMMASFFEESRKLKNERLQNELRISLEFPSVVNYLKNLTKK